MPNCQQLRILISLNAIIVAGPSSNTRCCTISALTNGTTVDNSRLFLHIVADFFLSLFNDPSTREQQIANKVDTTPYEESKDPSERVQPCCSYGDFVTHGSNKARHIGNDATNITCVSAPVDTPCVPVNAFRIIKVLYYQMSSFDKEIYNGFPHLLERWISCCW